MTKKFVLAPDSFKESMSAKEACLAMEKGILAVFKDADIQHVPMADGGGFLSGCNRRHKSTSACGRTAS